MAGCSYTWKKSLLLRCLSLLVLPVSMVIGFTQTLKAISASAFLSKNILPVKSDIVPLTGRMPSFLTSNVTFDFWTLIVIDVDVILTPFSFGLKVERAECLRINVH